MIPIKNLISTLPWHPTRRWNSRSLTRVKKIIVHQELGEASIENVNNYHIKKNHISPQGCPHFCYHYGIRDNGEVVQANELSSVTWHTGGQNSVSIGIMIQGNFNGPGYTLGSEGPGQDQIDALNQLIDYLLEAFNLSNQDVYGHYHFGKPACPGHVLQELVENRRNDIATPVVAKVEKSIKEVQKRLNKLGYAAGKVDGIQGIKTLTAIRKFQGENGLAVDGIVGPNTWKTLVTLTN